MLIEFVASFAAVAALVLVTHLAGFSNRAILADEGEARELAALLPGGFSATQVALCRHGRGALAMDEGGRLVVLRPHGAHFLAEPITSICLRRAGDGLLVEAGPAPPLALAVSPEWLGWADLREPGHAV